MLWTRVVPDDANRTRCDDASRCESGTPVRGNNRVNDSIGQVEVVILPPGDALSKYDREEICKEWPIAFHNSLGARAVVGDTEIDSHARCKATREISH